MLIGLNEGFVLQYFHYIFPVLKSRTGMRFISHDKSMVIKTNNETTNTRNRVRLEWTGKLGVRNIVRTRGPNRRQH